MVNRDRRYTHKDSHKYTKNHRRDPFLFLGFTQISRKPQVKQIRALNLLFFPSLGIHKDIRGLTRKPELLSLGFTQISQGSHSNPSPLLGIHTDIHEITRKNKSGLFPRFFPGFTKITLGSQRTRAFHLRTHTDIPGRARDSRPSPWGQHKHSWAIKILRSFS